MQTQRNWLWRFVLMVSGLAALWVLAASLSAPTSTSSWTPVDLLPSGGGDNQSGVNLAAGRILVGAGLILITTLFVVSALLASRRKRPMANMGFSLLSVVLMLLAMAMLRPDVLERLQQLQLTPPPAAPGAAAASTAGAPAVPPILPDVLVYGVSLLAAALVVVVLAWVTGLIVRRPQVQAPVTRQAAQVARTALADWQSGSPLANVIFRCYREMSELVAEKRAVQRAADMTPREFVQRLEKAGVPAQPAQQLTALFELARYSTQPLGAPEEAAARACLKALAEALESPA